MLMPQGDPSRGTYAGDNEAIWRDIRALWRRVGRSSKPVSGGGRVAFIQPDEPDAVTGEFWLDTDATPPVA